ncbi:MAG: hypothetical protein MUF42_08515 [Cytophagaceae bacterium]|jgi:hypothetical protein|nr:hypothetical protein [Cytophagaceae bacterium]
MKKIILAVIVLTLCASCAVHHGNYAGTPQDFDECVVAEIKGESKATYILGFGGLNKNQMVQEARKAMFNSRKLYAGEKYSNLTVDMQASGFLLYVRYKVTVSADVVKECGASAAPPNDAIMTKTSDERIAELKWTAGDTAIFYNGIVKRSPCVVDRAENNVADIEWLEKSQKLTFVSQNNLFKTTGSYKGFIVGNVYEYKDATSGTEQIKKGMIIGIGSKSFLVQTADQKYITVKY